MKLRHERSGKASTTSTRASSPLLEGEMALDRLLDLAYYELEHDPYRGMLAENSPWSVCQGVSEIVESSSSTALRKVFGTCHCACPSLVYWTEQEDAERNKRRNKRKRNKNIVENGNLLGQRPMDADFSCACDFNPLCLGSLGGVMNDLLEKAAKQILVDEDVSSIESKSQAENNLIEIDEVASLASEEPQPKRSKPSPDFSYTSDDASNVEPGKHRPSGVYQKEIKAEHMELDPQKDNAVYSSATADEMKQVRKTCEVAIAPVRSYVEGTILSHLENGGLSYESYMDELRKWHDSLSFSNPLLKTAPASGNDTLVIAIPPGIKNLGATCYLNTQFQCLARMTAFLNGLFSWTPSAENHQMDSVLSSMQLLFARMAHGSEATLTTQEFSDALGLENDEMQDPNEFARLLFERMHESFQQCSGQGEKEDLSQLLPKLFHGVTTYETTCLTCQNTTERSEGFMDLNLPIVHPDEGEADRKKSGQTKITDTFVGTADTNVQHCLNRYICAESLSGDNQYSCECCQGKRDAIRSITFRELPPVLNVQLSRYVFDRKKFVKKKLTDKVLLPRVLTVPMKGKDIDSTYLLCAVMKHHGTSAYQGHYIAEAMDWQSGTWFEFNDEMVSVLDGPSCSYAPEEFENLDEKVKGSQHAYNLYYVEETFLAECASNFLTTRAETQAETEQTSVLAKVRSERNNRYSLLSEMCLNDGKVARRLLRRRVGLMNKLSEKLSSPNGGIAFDRQSSVPAADPAHLAEPKQSVWVDGEVLRRFLSCDKTENSFAVPASGPLLRHRHLLCEHGNGLHPRVARRGKLLPRPIYDVLVALMLGEQCMINGEDHQVAVSLFDEDIVNDCIITPEQNMYCEKCANSYKADLEQKMDGLCRLRQLYAELDPKANKIDIEDESSEESGAGETVFLVSKKFVTQFRTRISSLLKAVAASELQSDPKCQANGKGKVYCQGLDTVDLSDFGASSPSESLDSLVNMGITCEHGNCNPPSKNSFRRVSGDVWTQLLLWFPNAICHEVGKNVTNQEVRCDLCEKEKTNDEAHADRLREWGKAAVASPLLKQIVKRRRTPDEVTMQLLATESDDETFGGKKANDAFLVHSKDVEAWRDAVKEVKKHSGKSTPGLIEKLGGKLFAQGAEPTKVRFSVYDRIKDRMTPLICAEHLLPIERAVLNLDAQTSGMCVSLVNTFVEVFTAAEYVAFIGSIYDLGVLLLSDNTAQEDTSTDEPHVTPVLLRRLQQSHHPRLRDPVHSLSESSFYMNFDALIKRHYTEGICSDDQCLKDFDEENDWVAYQAQRDEAKSNCVDLYSESIIVDVPDDSVEFPFRAFQIDSGADFDKAITSILGLPPSGSMDAATEAAYGSLRRSTRRRRTTYSNGTIVREDSLQICPHYNIAAVRLFLYEKCPCFPLDQDLSLIIPKCRDSHVDMTVDGTANNSLVTSGTSHQYITVEMPYEWNEQSLKDIVASALEGTEGLVPKSSLESHLRSQVFLCWNDGKGKSKEKESLVPQETLMEGLLELTNVSSKADGNSETKRSSRRAERGFRGTLLHSSAPTQEKGSEDADESKHSDENMQSNEVGTANRRDDKENRVYNVEDEPQQKKKRGDKTSVDGNVSTAFSDPDVVVLEDEFQEQQSVNTGGMQSDESLSVLIQSGPSDTRHLRSSIRDRKEEAIVNRLFQSVCDELSTEGMQSLIHSQCLEAARWAIARNPSETTVNALTDEALAKYYENMI